MSAAAEPAVRELPVVVVADGDPGTRAVIAAAIARAVDCRVVQAEDGAHAIQLALQRRPAAAVLDLELASLDGVRTALAIMGLLPALPIALHGADPERLRARAAHLHVPLLDRRDAGAIAAWVAAELGPPARLAVAVQLRS